MKTVLVTGGTGFIGKHFIQQIKEKTKSNQKFIFLSSRPIDGEKTILHRNYSFTKSDFMDQGINQIDSVIHLGAFTPKSNKEANWNEQSFSNISNTKYLIDNLPNTPDKFIFCSTLDVYGNVEKEIDEKTLISPVSLYGYSKLYCEKMLESWAEEKGILLQILRLGHIYGAGEEAYKKLVPMVIENTLNNIPPKVFNGGSEVRSFLHVSDCCKFILKSLELEKKEGIINIVSNRSVSVSDIVKMIVNISGKKLKIENVIVENNPRNLRFDASKRIHLLGNETIELYDGLKEEYEAFEETEPDESTTE